MDWYDIMTSDDSEKVSVTRGELRRLRERADNGNGTQRKVVTTVVTAVAAAIVSLLGWGGLQLQELGRQQTKNTETIRSIARVTDRVDSHEVRLTRIEETRFTTSDAAALRRELLEESPLVTMLSSIQETLRRVEQRLDKLERRP